MTTMSGWVSTRRRPKPRSSLRIESSQRSITLTKVRLEHTHTHERFGWRHCSSSSTAVVGGNPETFKAITKAYAVLSDKHKRRHALNPPPPPPPPPPSSRWNVHLGDDAMPGFTTPRARRGCLGRVSAGDLVEQAERIPATFSRSLPTWIRCRERA